VAYRVGAVAPALWSRGKEDLAADTHKCELAYFDHPLYSSEEPTEKAMYASWKEALIPNGVDVVVNGHSHTYERFDLQDADGVATSLGARQFVVGTGGKNTRALPASKLPNSQASSDTTFGVLKLALHPTSYSWGFMPITGQSFTDAGTTECH
jgi:acid phosphatase type 7